MNRPTLLPFFPLNVGGDFLSPGGGKLIYETTGIAGVAGLGAGFVAVVSPAIVD